MSYPTCVTAYFLELFANRQACFYIFSIFVQQTVNSLSASAGELTSIWYLKLSESLCCYRLLVCQFRGIYEVGMWPVEQFWPRPNNDISKLRKMGFKKIVRINPLKLGIKKLYYNVLPTYAIYLHLVGPMAAWNDFKKILVQYYNESMTLENKRGRFPILPLIHFSYWTFQ